MGNYILATHATIARRDRVASPCRCAPECRLLLATEFSSVPEYLRYPLLVLLWVVALMSGILSIGRELLGIYRGNQVVPRTLFWNCVIIAFVISGGILWFLEHQRATAAEAKLEDLTKPKLGGRIIQATRLTPIEGELPLVLTMKVWNRGADSIASGYLLTVTSPSGKSFRTFPVTLRHSFNMLNPDGSTAGTIAPENFLFEKTTAAAIVRGAPKTGPVLYGLKVSDIEAIGGITNATLKVTVLDDSDKAFDCEPFQIGAGPSQPYMHVPGQGGKLGDSKE